MAVDSAAVSALYCRRSITCVITGSEPGERAAMKSYRVVAFGAPLEEAELETPAPQGTEVLLEVGACGVCHTDVHLWEGYFDLGGGKKQDMSQGMALPRAMGHEITGEVVAMGGEAQGVAVGDRRLVYPWIGCGGCELCAGGEEHLCARPRALGVNLDGGYADHVLVPHPRYLLEADGLPEPAACTLACSGLTAYGALARAGPLKANDPLLIIGAGGLGLAAVGMARMVLGVAPIVADIDPEKRKAAEHAGAAQAIDPGEAGAARRLVKATGGVAAAIDFVGAASSAQFGVDLLRKGGRLVVVGLFGGAITLPLPHFPFRAITITGSYVGSLRQLRELVALAREGRVHPVPVEARPLERAQASLDDLKAGRIVGRIVLTP